MDSGLDTGRTDEAYSITEVASMLGESRPKIYRWIEAFEQADDFRRSGQEHDKGKYYPRTHWDALLTSVGRKLPIAEHVEVEIEPPKTGFSGLVQPSASSGLGVSGFDMAGYRQHKEILENQTAQRAQDIDNAVTAYAQSRIAQTLADIDVAAAQIRANAFKAMGMNGDSES